ncbi:hypothetical protein [Sinorhizobium meliloti]|uniref:hypothetical protein n=1 Tax=Rhizobium meliloti TaxID=382 RepID=UPI001F1EB4B9|nr:hypothetical protein [Sinorhizobium meliloti]
MTDENTTGAVEDPKTTGTQTAPSNDAVDTSKSGQVDTGAAPKAGATDAGAAPAGDGELQAFREKLAGGDETILKQLGRYKSIDAISRGFREAYNTAKNGGPKLPALSDKSTPEEVKAYREAMGIPEDPTAYPGDFREGYQATDADKAILGDFKTAMHARNVPPAAAAAALEWYQDFATAQQQELDGNLAKVAKETQSALRNEWGGEYDGNIGAAQQLMTSHLGKEGFEGMMGLRLMDGSRLQDNIAFVKMMAQLGADYYGGNAIMTGDVETTAKTVQESIDELLALRVSDPEKYKSDDVQQKITKLYAQRDKINARR